MQRASDLLGLDHVAPAVADVGAMQVFLGDHLGMHELARGRTACSSAPTPLPRS